MGSKYGKMKTFVNKLNLKADLADKERQELHMIDGNYYVISRIIAPDHGEWETMIFNSDKDGEIQGWGELYSYRGMEPFEETIRKFQEDKHGQTDQDGEGSMG
jgi:hypothetical protein